MTTDLLCSDRLFEQLLTAEEDKVEDDEGYGERPDTTTLTLVVPQYLWSTWLEATDNQYEYLLEDWNRIVTADLLTGCDCLVASDVMRIGITSTALRFLGMLYCIGHEIPWVLRRTVLSVPPERIVMCGNHQGLNILSYQAQLALPRPVLSRYTRPFNLYEFLVLPLDRGMILDLEQVIPLWRLDLLRVFFVLTEAQSEANEHIDPEQYDELFRTIDSLPNPGERAPLRQLLTRSFRDFNLRAVSYGTSMTPNALNSWIGLLRERPEFIDHPIQDFWLTPCTSFSEWSERCALVDRIIQCPFRRIWLHRQMLWSVLECKSLLTADRVPTVRALSLIFHPLVGPKFRRCCHRFVLNDSDQMETLVAMALGQPQRSIWIESPFDFSPWARRLIESRLGMTLKIVKNIEPVKGKDDDDDNDDDMIRVDTLIDLAFEQMTQGRCVLSRNLVRCFILDPVIPHRLLVRSPNRAYRIWFLSCMLEFTAEERASIDAAKDWKALGRLIEQPVVVDCRNDDRMFCRLSQMLRCAGPQLLIPLRKAITQAIVNEEHGTTRFFDPSAPWHVMTITCDFSESTVVRLLQNGYVVGQDALDLAGLTVDDVRMEICISGPDHWLDFSVISSRSSSFSSSSSSIDYGDGDGDGDPDES